MITQTPFRALQVFVNSETSQGMVSVLLVNIDSFISGLLTLC